MIFNDNGGVKDGIRNTHEYWFKNDFTEQITIKSLVVVDCVILDFLKRVVIIYEWVLYPVYKHYIIVKCLL